MALSGRLFAPAFVILGFWYAEPFVIWRNLQRPKVLESNTSNMSRFTIDRTRRKRAQLLLM